MLSLNKLLGNGRSSYVVSCELPDGTDHHVVKSRNFDCSSADDLGAQANAVRFAKGAETVPEFRAFLFGDSGGQRRDQRIRVTSYVCMREKPLTGVRFAVAMCRLDNGQLRSISFCRGTGGDDVTDARGENQVLLGKAEQFLRSVAFENWRKQVSKDSPLKSREQAHGSQQNLGKERGLKHPHSFVEIDQGEKVDCKCGKNRSHGLMMACERCGAWEHAECQGFRSKQQIPADYICSACVRAEREEVIIIRSEEQGKLWSSSVENAHTGMAFREHEDPRHVCYLCGCEDNEYFEPLVQPCGCVGCSLVAHTSCITTMKLGASYKDQRLQRPGICCFCGSSMKDDVGNEIKLQKGGRWVEEVPDNGNTKLGKNDQLGVARKRLRSTGSGGSAVPGKPEHGEKLSAKSSKNEKVLNTVHVEKVQPEASPPDTKKGSSLFLGRRFSDAAANVPIKKRRIQLEMARSPSPPPGNLKPENTSVHEVLVATKPSDSQSSEDVNVTDGDSDENGSGSQTFSAAAQVQTVASKAPVAVNIFKATGLGVTAPGTDTEGGVVGTSTHQLVGCKSEKGEGKLQPRGNRSITENGTSPVEIRSKEESSLVLLVDVQQQQIPPAHVASAISHGGEGEQACSLKLGIQSEDILSDPSREVCTVLSPNSKRKFSETDMGYPARDHLREEESSRSRPTNRAGSVNFQTSAVGSTGEENVRGVTQDGSAVMQASALAGNNNSLRDDRLHWDLNMDMEEWERPSAEDDAIATVQNLPSTPNSVVEKRGGLVAKEFLQESHKLESGGAVGTSTSLEDGRLEHKSPAQDSADAMKQFSTAEGKDSALKSEIQVESKDEISSGPSRMAEDQRRLVSSPGAVVGTHTTKLHDYLEDQPEMFRNSLQADRSAPALLKDNQRRELEIAPAPDQEEEVRLIDESPRVGGPIVDKETKGQVFLIADKGNAACTSGLPDGRADTSCVNAEEDICGTQSVREPAVSNEAADIVQPEKQPECHTEDLSQKGHAEVLMTPMLEPTSVIPLTKISSTRNATEAQKCDEGEGAPHVDEDLIDKEVVEEFIHDRNRSSTSPSRQPATVKWEGDNGEDLEAEDVDYGDSDMREGDDVDMEDRLQRGAAEVESTWNPYHDTKVSGVQDASASQPASAVQDASASQNAAASQDASASPSHRGDADDLSNVTGSFGLGRKRRYLSESSGARELQGMIVEEVHAVQAEDPKRVSTAEKGSPKSEMNGDLVADEDKGGDEHGNVSGASVATSDSRRTSLERAEDVAGTARSGKARKSEVWRESSEGGSRVRTKSGWDQLPEGFQSAEEALQANRSNAGQTGWGPHYQPGYSGWNGGPNMHYPSGDNRYVPGHGRGMLPGPAAERAPFEKSAWSRGEHPRRSRMDAGLEIHGRVPLNQDLRQSSGSRPRMGSLEPGHRQRRQGGWADDGGGPPPLFMYGPGRHMSPPGPGREPYGFHPHKTRNAAAVAAAKVESSGLVVAPDGTVIKAGAGAPAPLRGMGGKGRGVGFGDMTPNGVMTGVGNTGLSHSLRIGADVDLRVPGGADAPPHFKRVDRFGGSFPPGSSMARGAPAMLGTPSRYRWTRDERGFGPQVEPEERPLFSKRTSTSLPQRSRLSPPLIPDDGAAQPRKSRITTTQVTEPEAEVAKAAEPDSSAPPPPKLPLPPPPRAQRSPPAGLKRLISKRDGVDWPRGRERSRDRDREWDSSSSRERPGPRSHYSPSRRSSPHVIHGSALTDERDRLLLAGIDRSRDSVSAEDLPQASHRGRSMEDVHDATRRGRHNEDLGAKSRAQSKDASKELSRVPVTDRRDFQKPGVNYKHSSSREGEDDVAPRRRRPS